MLRHFPISEPDFRFTMNARAYDGHLIEVDPDTYAEQVTLRREIVRSDPNYYHACDSPNAGAMAWEIVALALRDMARTYPDWFSLEERESRRRWTNRLLDETTEFKLGDLSSLPLGALSPLDWLGQQVQEDLIIMQVGDAGEAVCAAGHLCFAAGWSLRDKIGQSFLRIHEHVPGFADQIGMPSDLLLRRLKPNRTVMRFNWTISESDDLNRAPKCRENWLRKGKLVTAENAGERCFLRVERQTLTRLPETGGILFTIRTYISPMAEVCADPERRRLLAGSLQSMPPEMVRYKSATAYFDALLAYVRCTDKLDAAIE